MNAFKSNIYKYLGDTCQYLITVYQRTYSLEQEHRLNALIQKSLRFELTNDSTQPNTQIETYYVSSEMKKVSISINKPVISKWRSAEQQCIELEKFFGNEAVDVSRQNVGYDLESATPNGEKRYIDVKLLNSTSASFTITNNEYTAAYQHGVFVK